MSLPVEISPNPLISAAVELRFDSSFTEESILQTFYPLLNFEFPNVATNEIPRDFKKVPAFQFSSDFIFSNDQYSIGIGKNVVVFENVSGYALWSNYFNLIKKYIAVIFNGSFEYELLRLGLRYISILEGAEKMNDAVKLGLNFTNQFNYELSKQTYRVLLSKDFYSLQLQISEGATAKKENKENKGLYIDIDISRVAELPSKDHPKLLETIDNMHTLEKELFFSILTEDQLTKMKPRY